MLNIEDADVNAMLRNAFDMSSQDSLISNGDNTETENQVEEAKETVDSAEDNVDNNESEDGTEGDEDYEETSEDELVETEEETEEEQEPEDETYDSGYVYFDEGLNKKVFLKVTDENGKGSIYLNRVEAERGLKRQLDYIANLEAKQQEEKERYEEELIRLKKDLQIYELTAKPDQIRQALITDKMPEKYRSVDPKTLAESEYAEYRSHRIDAEIAVDREIRQAQEEAAQKATESQKSKERAEKHIKDRTKDASFFGLGNTEDKFVVDKKLKEVPEGSKNTYYEMAVEIARAFGETVADQFLKAAVQDILSVAVPDSKRKVQETEAPARKVEQVEKIKKKVKVKKVPASSGGNPVPTPADPRQLINMAFAQNKRQ